MGPPLASSVKHCVTLGQSGCLLPFISGHHGQLISGNISSEPDRFPHPLTITHWGMGRLSPESCAPRLCKEITSLWDGQETPAPLQGLLHVSHLHRKPVLPDRPCTLQSRPPASWLLMLSAHKHIGFGIAMLTISSPGMVMSSTPLSYSDRTGPRLCGGGCLRFHTWFLICEKTNETRGLGFCMLSVAVKRDRRQALEEDAGVT